MKDYSVDQFNFELPEELIAQSPSDVRDHSRLMVLNKKNNTIEHRRFFNIIDYLRPGDVLVRNNSKVIPARLFGEKKETGAHVEVLLLRDTGNDIYECLCGNAKVIKVGTVISFGDNQELNATCLEVKDEGIRMLKLSYNGILFEILDKLGNMPLPPYIHKQCYDNSRYQTVYAKKEGSAAAPTAGFHFTDELFDKIKDMGVEVLDVTLHIGLGTFRPVKVDNILDHHMHSEYFEMTKEVADRLNLAKKEGRRIISIGTTSTRTLEAIFSKYNQFVPCKESTNIFIYPGYKFKAIDALITNFHLPKSTLIMLVSAFAGQDFVLSAYKNAVEEKYRFFSFGDSMFIYE